MALPVFIKLEGGLGNQLFQFAAGFYLAKKLGTNLIVDQYGLPLSSVRGEKFTQLQEFEIAKEMGASLKINSRQISYINRELSLRSPFYKRVILKNRVHSSWPWRLRVFAETSDHDFFSIESPVKLHGNFQSWRIVEEASKFGFPRKLEIINREKIIERVKLPVSLSNSIAIHLRLGKDALANTGYSQPGALYYQKGIQRLRRELQKVHTVFVFSDEVELARSFVKGNLDVPDAVFIEDRGLSSADTLYLMSKFRGLVCANSTFSTWAGWSIGNRGGLVVVPTPIADGDHGDRVSRDFPPNWIKIEK